MKGGKLSLTTRYVLTFGILLFVANTVLGIVILSQSTTAMRTLINKDMLDVVKSAAGSLDGDVLGALTEDDVDGPVFCDIEDRLLVFQNSVDNQFIYAVKQVDKDHYVFTVDPDPVDPGAFGEDVLQTPALIAAAKGVPTVDESPAADRWGNFYSAYCPVFDSSGKVAGIIGVDFDAAWYDAQVQKYTMSIAIVTFISVLLGGVVVALITRRVRIKFSELDNEISGLSEDVDHLMDEMATYSNMEMPRVGLESGLIMDDDDELGVLGDKIRLMQVEMRLYLDYLHMQAYTDALTRVGSSTAYHEIVKELAQKITDGTAAFWVAVFDVNSLKELNDTHGHECGDQYIKGAAEALKIAFSNAKVFRIGGDEFAVIAENVDEAHMNESLRKAAEGIDAFNKATPYPAKLTVSQGMAQYVPEQDSSYREVFARADKIMYENKREYYRTVGDRRRH